MTDKNRQKGNESVGEKSDGLALGVAVRERAKAFAREHCRVLAQEIVEWQDTAVLANGRLRELAAIWAEIDGAYSLNLAENSAIREALEIAARPAPESSTLFGMSVIVDPKIAPDTFEIRSAPEALGAAKG
ncbi:hypothetical protein [Cupriavidus pauculus]|uniref:hypothetical protein n=1 Tax=Cupriavidus pauculus TaxID=82633 RepID=UPI0007808CA0|nr:hypothetical protein [Cupriavidus pauculus]